jgi:hypothetical protein
VQRLTAAFIAVGVTVVVAVTLLTIDLHGRTQQHLLDLQVRQAASTLAAALPVIQTQLEDSVQIADASGSTAAFERFVRARTQASGFTSVSLWRRVGGSVVPLARVGSPPALISDGQAAFLAGGRPGVVRVTDILPDGGAGALGYAVTLRGSDLVVYAESPLPARRHLTVPRSSPFADLNFALYLNSVTPAHLLESSVPTPVRGRRATASAPFGDASIILVGTPTVDLAGGLSATLPWIVLAVGAALTLSAAAMTELLGRRRRLAEALAADNQRLFLEQRNIAASFQRALLPLVAETDDLEVKAVYLPGTAGIDVGGDWYDMVSQPGRCVFVVGDVCGRGVGAAATMASLRFATRAFISAGDGPRLIVEKLARMREQEEADEAFATLVIGEIDTATRRVTVVNAGHPPLLMMGPDGRRYLDAPAAPPVGVGGPPPEPVAYDLPEGVVLVAYTDGLVERRDEGLGAGLDRLRDAPVDFGRPLSEMLDSLVAEMLPQGALDDTAILAMRWRPGGGAPSTG